MFKANRTFPSVQSAIDRLVSLQYAVSKANGEVVAVRKSPLPYISIRAEIHPAPAGDGVEVSFTHTRIH